MSSKMAANNRFLMIIMERTNRVVTCIIVHIGNSLSSAWPLFHKKVPWTNKKLPLRFRRQGTPSVCRSTQPRRSKGPQCDTHPQREALHSRRLARDVSAEGIALSRIRFKPIKKRTARTSANKSNTTAMVKSTALGVLNQAFCLSMPSRIRIFIYALED